MSAADVAIQFALNAVGKPYQWGATGPNSYDCSGLVQASYKAAGINLPRTTQFQVTAGSPVTRAELGPGDLVFPDPGHVQIYLGNNYIVEAPHTGAKVRTVPMWGFWQGRRVTPPGAVAADGKGGVYIQLPATDAHGNVTDPALKKKFEQTAGGADSGGLIPDPLHEVNALIAVITNFAHLAEWLMNGQNWTRLALGGLGVLLTYEAAKTMGMPNAN